jgi:hypothetical protein
LLQVQLTGAGIAALSGSRCFRWSGSLADLVVLSGGSLQSAFGPGAVAQAPTVPTSQLNANALKAATDATGKNLLLEVLKM